MAKYGQTWWGEKWLNALSDIDYSNRLPRGKTYANNGSVLTLKIKENCIQAKVRGSRKMPYSITIIIPPYEPKTGDKLVDEISRNPVLIAKLLNRELDPEVMQIASRLHIQVFPASWSDLKMTCSCPDWAVPCKHLAAVIYKLSTEIDNNPFLVFELHRINLVDALKKHHIVIEKQAKAKLPDIGTILGILKPEPVEIPGQIGNELGKAVDYSAIPDILDPLISILTDEPAFYIQGNFRESYTKIMKRVSRLAAQLLSGKAIAEKATWQVGFEDEIRVVYHEDFKPLITCGKRKVTVDELITGLLQISVSVLPDYTVSVQALHELLFLSLHLMNKGAAIPQIFMNRKKKCFIRWVPALCDIQVRHLVQGLSNRIPPGMLQYERGKTVKTCYLTAVSLVAMLLDYFIGQWSAPDKQDAVHNMFFAGKSGAFDSPGEKAVPAGISSWLSRLQMTHRQFLPVLKVDEGDDGNFEISIAIENRKDTREVPVPLSEVLKGKTYEKHRFDILQDLSLLSRLITGLEKYILSEAIDPVSMDNQEFVPFLFEALPALKLLDIKTILPKSLQKVLKPKLSMFISQKNKSSNGFARLEDLLDFDLRVAIGEHLFSSAEFEQMLRHADGLVKFKNNYIYLQPEELENLRKSFQKPLKLSGLDLLKTALVEEYMGAAIGLSDEVRALIKELTSNKIIELPKGLNAQMRPYQHRGYSWMYRNTRIGFGSLIADDMGLGKTIQVIAALQKFKEEGALDKSKALVVAPTSLLTNWNRELARFTPGLEVAVYHGMGRSMPLHHFDVLLTSYGVLRREMDIFKSRKWLFVIADEAQNIKNIHTKQTQAIKSIPARNFIAMSGTPVENRLMEYWSIMDFANRGLLGTSDSFMTEFGRPIQESHSEHALEKFKKITGPFLMRRLKSDKSIISDLPDKLEQNQYCALSKQQAALYETTLRQCMEAITLMSSNKDMRAQRLGLILKMITSLKQICNHPTQFLKDERFDPELSGKTQMFLDILETLHDNREKSIIFTQYTEMAELLLIFIRNKFGQDPLYLHGGLSRNKRDAQVTMFQESPKHLFFILSLKAGGTGLNLTAARNVIHYDLWWNPAVEAQATDRAYRIGQKNNVMVHRFITQGTFEEKIDAMIQSKKKLANLSVSAGESWIGNLSNKELNEVFSL